MERIPKPNALNQFRKSTWIFLVLFFSLALAPNILRGAQVTLRIAQAVDALAFLPVYVARAQNFFNDEGINLELIIVQGGGPDLQALIAGSVDFDATSTGGLLRSFGGGIELLAVHNIVGKCIIDLVIRKESAQRLGITTTMAAPEKLRRLKGAIIGASRVGSLTYQIAFYLAKEAGLEQGKEVTILGVGGGDSALAALKTGKIDVMSYAPPFPQVALKDGDAISLVANSKGEYPKLNSFLQNVLLTRPDYAKKNPDMTRRVLRAMVRGNKWVAEHDARDVARAVTKFFKNTPADVLLNTVEAIKPAVIADGKLTLDGLKGVEEVYRVNGIIKKPVPWDRLVTNEYLPQ
jgi:NitT/TauT family transport system substrate-binding protein